MSRVPGWRNGRREGLKILCQLNGVRVRVPLPALSVGLVRCAFFRYTLPDQHMRL